MPTDSQEIAKRLEDDLRLVAQARRDAAEKDAAMAEEKKTEELKDAAKADADAGEKLDRILECLDSLTGRMDAYDKGRMDGAEAAMVSDKKRRDGEDEKEMKEEGEPEEIKVDKKHKKDSYSDSAEIRNELSDIQSRADEVCSAWNLEARRPMQNEFPHEYRRRVATPLKQHSAAWKDVDLKELSGQALKVATDQIFSDAYTAATCNDTFAGAGTLREVRSVDPNTGARIKTYYGDPIAWMGQFAGHRRLAKFNLDAGRK